MTGHRKVTNPPPSALLCFSCPKSDPSHTGCPLHPYRPDQTDLRASGWHPGHTPHPPPESHIRLQSLRESVPFVHFLPAVPLPAWLYMQYHAVNAECGNCCYPADTGGFHR